MTHQRWTQAIKECTTEYIHLAHHDDVYLPTFYEEAVRYLDDHPDAAAVFTLDYIIDERGNRTGQTTLAFEPKDVYDFDFILDKMIRHGNFLRCPSVVFRTSMVDDLEYPECDSASDTAMWFNVLANAGPIGIIPKPLFLYRKSSASDTQKNIIGTPRQWDHVRALEYAVSLRPNSLKWDTYITLAKLTAQRKQMEDVYRVQERAKQAKRINLIVVHERPDNAGTGVVAAHRCRQENAFEDGTLTYYVYPDHEHKIIRESYINGCPCIAAHPSLFLRVVQQLQPVDIEYHHTIGWGEDILAVETSATKALYLHDRWMWSDHPHRNGGLVRRELPPGIAVYANSPFLQAEAREHLGVEVGLFDPFVPLPPHPKYKRIVGFFGYFNETKGVGVLLQAMRRLPDHLLLMFCDVQPELMEGRKIYGHENVLVMGSYRRSDLHACARLVDVVAIPSLFESYGLVKKEIESTGVKVVATHVGGMAGDVEPGDTDSLVEAILNA